jgi:hypothetical protein
MAVLLGIGVATVASAQTIRLGFIGDEGAFGDFNKTALKWAKAQYATEVIKPSDLSKTALTNFAVLWWQDGDTDPQGLMGDPGKKALKAYLDGGGTILLSSAAERLANELGIETGTPRSYGPGADNHAAGVTIRKDSLNHPVWEGFKRAEGEQIQVTSLGYPKSSDYWSLLFVEAVTIGDTWETGADWKDQVGAFVEWRLKSGVVFGMGWRLPHWSADNKDIKNLQQLTSNVIAYLASESAFLSVDPNGNAITQWARLKAER